MNTAFEVAVTHLRNRRRQTLVSLGGVVLGVAFFLAVSSLMRGSEKDFLKRLVDNSSHITVADEFRAPAVQPALLRWPQAALSMTRVKPRTETRGIRSYRQKLQFIESIPDLRVAPVLMGSAVLIFAGREQGVALSGVVPEKMRSVSTIEEKLVAGSLEALSADANGILVGQALADKFVLRMGSTVSVVASGGNRAMKIVGLGLMKILSMILLKPPGVIEPVPMPIYWGFEQHLLAACFAMLSCSAAAYLPARRAGRVHPVDILRGAA